MRSQLETLRLLYNQIDINDLVISCRHDYNNYMFSHYNLDLYKKPINANTVHDRFSLWCSLYISLNNNSLEIKTFVEDLHDIFPEIIELQQTISATWTPNPKQLTLQKALKQCIDLIDLLRDIVYYLFSFEKYNEIRQSLGYSVLFKHDDNFSKQTNNSIIEWEKIMIQWMYRVDGEIYNNCHKSFKLL